VTQSCFAVLLSSFVFVVVILETNPALALRRALIGCDNLTVGIFNTVMAGGSNQVKPGVTSKIAADAGNLFVEAVTESLSRPRSTPGLAELPRWIWSIIASGTSRIQPDWLTPSTRRFT